MKLTNQERWIRAMSKVSYSLIGHRGYTEEDARFVCQCFRENPPKRVTDAEVRGLENELTELPDASLSEATTLVASPVTNQVVETKPALRIKKPYRQRKVESKSEDYPEPWCRVTNTAEELLRYEDSNGNPIPEVLWAMK